MNIPLSYPPRFELIKWLVKQLDAQSYLEIGCDYDENFNRVPVHNKIGVDPLRGGNRRMTSDEFFAVNTQTFDLIFVDGLHHYDQVTRDINNSLNCLNPHGILMIHDMLPVESAQAQVPRPDTWGGPWLGDVWRVGFDLMARDDVTFAIVAIDCGCGLVLKQPQTAIKLPVESSWHWYQSNWQQLPLIDFHRIDQHRMFSEKTRSHDHIP